MFEKSLENFKNLTKFLKIPDVWETHLHVDFTVISKIFQKLQNYVEKRKTSHVAQTIQLMWKIWHHEKEHFKSLKCFKEVSCMQLINFKKITIKNPWHFTIFQKICTSRCTKNDFIVIGLVTTEQNRRDGSGCLISV